MRSVLKSGFFWQFAGGFVLGAVGFVTLQPTDVTQMLKDNVSAAVHAAR